MAVRLNRFVRRYTTLSSALETLGRRKLVLLSPAKWDDSNDAFLIELYRNRIQAKSVLALCCTMASETYHHWRVFTQGIEGVCLEFERVPLSRALNAIEDVTAGKVDYLRIKDLEALDDPERLPFVKRLGYSDEREWRVVATCRDDRKGVRGRVRRFLRSRRGAIDHRHRPCDEMHIAASLASWRTRR